MGFCVRVQELLQRLVGLWLLSTGLREETIWTFLAHQPDITLLWMLYFNKPYVIFYLISWEALGCLSIVMLYFSMMIREADPTHMVRCRYSYSQYINSQFSTQSELLWVHTLTWSFNTRWQFGWMLRVCFTIHWWRVYSKQDWGDSSIKHTMRNVVTSWVKLLWNILKVQL